MVFCVVLKVLYLKTYGDLFLLSFLGDSLARILDLCDIVFVTLENHFRLDVTVCLAPDVCECSKWASGY